MVGWWLVVGTIQARIGEVETWDGTRIVGHVRLLTNGILVVNADAGDVTRVGLTNLRALYFFDDQPSLLQPEAFLETGPLAETGLPPHWQSRDLGTPSQAGTTVFQYGVFSLRSAGDGLQATSDSCHFAFKTVTGDSEIVARIVHVPPGHPGALAGVMMRAGLEAEAPHVLLAVASGRPGWLQWRDAGGRPPMTTAQPDLRPPAWLKLKRSGPTVTAYKSRNGRHWRLAGDVPLAFPGAFYVGLAAAGSRGHPLDNATFDQVQEAPAVRLNGYQPRLRLRSGSTIVAGIQQADRTDVSLYSLMRQPPIRTPQLACLLFDWLPERLAPALQWGRPGVLLTSGEFVDGDFRGLIGGRVTISSVLFGLRSFDVNGEVIAVVLDHARPASTRFLVKTVNGSTLLAGGLTLGWNEVALQEPVLGSWRLPLSELKEIQQLPR